MDKRTASSLIGKWVYITIRLSGHAQPWRGWVHILGIEKNTMRARRKDGGELRVGITRITNWETA